MILLEIVNNDIGRKKSEIELLERQVKLSLFAADMRLYLDNLRESTGKQIERKWSIKLIHRNLQSSYTQTKTTANIMKDLLYVSRKRIKWLGINSPRSVQNLWERHWDNFKGDKSTLQKWKDKPYSEKEKPSIINILITLNQFMNLNNIHKNTIR